MVKSSTSQKWIVSQSLRSVMTRVTSKRSRSTKGMPSMVPYMVTPSISTVSTSVNPWQDAILQYPVVNTEALREEIRSEIKAELEYEAPSIPTNAECIGLLRVGEWLPVLYISTINDGFKVQKQYKLIARSTCTGRYYTIHHIMDASITWQIDLEIRKRLWLQLANAALEGI